MFDAFVVNVFFVSFIIRKKDKNTLKKILYANIGNNR